MVLTFDLFGGVAFLLFLLLAGGSNEAARSSSLLVRSESFFLVVVGFFECCWCCCLSSSSMMDWIVNPPSSSSSFPAARFCFGVLFLVGETSFPVPISSSCVASFLCGMIPGLFFLCLHNSFQPCTSIAITCAALSSFSVFSCSSLVFLLTIDGLPCSLLIDTCPCETRNDNVKTFSINCANDCPLNTKSTTGHSLLGNLFNSLTIFCIIFAVVFSWSFFVDSNSSGLANSPRGTLCCRWVIFRSLISVFMTPFIKSNVSTSK
mmetsp:Transcript_2289/g.7259  ORF Transcript_2289/g.7259 Transcript_2289/m.7259 type:complete len:263 (+) Transcript_2289:94-882(+)